MSAPKNITELRDAMLDAFEWVKTDPRRAIQVREMANIAGKVMQAEKLRVEYAYLKGEEPDNPFLGKTSGIPLKPNARLLS